MSRSSPLTTTPVARRAVLRAALIAVLVASIGLGALRAQTASAGSSDATPRPTVVLVHAAWAQASSWNAVAARLHEHGYPVLVPDNPLRTLAGDAAAIAGVVQRVEGPIVLVGHSYGGAVITNAATGNPNVKALVYIAAFAPDEGESAFALATRALGSLVPVSLIPVPFTHGGEIGLDLYLNPLLFGAVFAQDLPAATAAAMADAQRPVTLAALAAQAATPAWRTIPSWYMVARNDFAIPPDAQRFMAQRAGATTTEIDSSHAVPVSRPDAVTDLILAAARTAVPPQPPAQAAVAGLRLSPTSFRAARSGPTVKAAATRAGTRVGYTLNVAAAVRFTVQRASLGRMVRGRCVKATSANRSRESCTRFVRARGSFTRSRPAGPDRFTFSGRLAGEALQPCRYRLVATPTATADGRSGRPAGARFRILG